MNTSEGNTYSVYMHVFPNDKVYVGITCTSLEFRWGKNGYKYNTQQLMWRAIQKYGWDNIQHIVVATCLTRDEANHMERNLIEMYDSANPEHGYNVDLGGQGSGRMSQSTKDKLVKAKTGTKMSEETKRKMSVSHVGRKHTPETLAKMSTSQIGRKHTEESKRRMSEVKKGKKWTAEQYTNYAIATGTDVLQYTMTGDFVARYNSMGEASRSTGIPKGNIRNCARCLYPSMNGFIWIIEKDFSEEVLAERIKKATKNRKVNPVAELDETGKITKVYTSMSQASKQHDMNRNTFLGRVGCGKPVDGKTYKIISFSDFEYYKSLGLLCV